MIIKRPVDIEAAVKTVLEPYFKVYVRPLPEGFELPSLLVQQVGGTEVDTIDTFSVTLDSRAKTDGAALDLLYDAIGVLRQSEIGWIAINALASWGTDPARPDLALCTARLEITAHQTTKTIRSSNTNGN